MDHKIIVKISPKTAAFLFITGELDLSDFSIAQDARQILDALNNLSVEELLEIIDNHTNVKNTTVGECPQFGKIETLIKVPQHIIEHGTSSYAQLGILLKGHNNDDYDANRKYGEHYGKTASLLGLVSIETNENGIGCISSALTAAFCSLNDRTQLQIIPKLAFRTNCIQVLLRKARLQSINGYDIFIDGTTTTRGKKKEGICHFLQHMRELGNPELMERIQNIYWEE